MSENDLSSVSSSNTGTEDTDISDIESDSNIVPERRSTRQKKIRKRSGVSEVSYDDIINSCNIIEEQTLELNSDENSNHENDSLNKSAPNIPVSNSANPQHMTGKESFDCEKTIDQLFDGLRASVLSEMGKRFDYIEKKLNEVQNNILRIEVKFLSRRDSVNPARKRSRLLSIDKEQADSPIDLIASFGFPLKSIEKVERFNNDLNKDDYRERTFQALLHINGDNGEMNAGKVIRSLFYSIFSKDTLGNYTYTGKNKNTKKFKVLTNILKLIFDLLKAADRSYTLAEFERDTVDKVFKYAYKGRDSTLPSPRSVQNIANRNQTNIITASISSEPFIRNERIESNSINQPGAYSRDFYLNDVSPNSYGHSSNYTQGFSSFQNLNYINCEPVGISSQQNNQYQY